MSVQKTIQLMLQLQIEGADRGELDLQTRQLLREIRAGGVGSAELVSRPLKQGTNAMSAAETEAIAVELGPVVLPTLLGTVALWIQRDKGRSVKFNGMVNEKLVEFEGNLDDFKRMTAMLKRFEMKVARAR